MKKSKTSAILNMDCPKCHKGKLFYTPTFSFRKPIDMPDNCPECGQNFLPEPGFYYGAMFVSYIWTAFLALIIIGTCMWVFDMSVNASFGVLVLFYALIFVWIFRISRSIWIHVNVQYDENAIEAHKAGK